jgi:hypothetical protein
LTAAGKRDIGSRAQLLDFALATDMHATGQPVQRVDGVFRRSRSEGGRRALQRLERGAHLTGSLGPVPRVLGKQPDDQALEHLRDIGVVPCGRDRRRPEVLRDDRERVVRGERNAAGHELVEHHSERIQVGARVDATTERLLRGDVGKRPDQAALQGKARDRRAVALSECGDEPEIAELRHAVRIQPDVRRLQVAVHDAIRVSVRERRADVSGDAHRQV